VTGAAGLKRAVCTTCLRAQSACICRWITPVSAQAHLLILQHPLEVGNAKNSARLLHLCVTGSVMAAGEAFDAGVLDSLLHAEGRTPVLLYPATPYDAGLPAPPPMPALPAEALRLVLLDATWRKSRKMLYLNPALQRLPRLGLTDVAPSNYRIRSSRAWKRRRRRWGNWNVRPGALARCSTPSTGLSHNRRPTCVLEP
jgi:DTW domain-containing protein YfiP